MLELAEQKKLLDYYSYAATQPWLVLCHYWVTSHQTANWPQICTLSGREYGTREHLIQSLNTLREHMKGRSKSHIYTGTIISKKVIATGRFSFLLMHTR